MQLVKELCESYGKHIPVITTGGKAGQINEGKDESDKRELASLTADGLKRMGIPEEDIIEQTSSKNTKEDVTHTVGNLSFEQLYSGGDTNFNNVLAVTKTYHATRCYLTLRKYAPGATVYLKNYDWSFTGQAGFSSQWNESESGVSYVWGEFKRIVTYARKGDIIDPRQAFPDLDIKMFERLAAKV